MPTRRTFLAGSAAGAAYFLNAMGGVSHGLSSPVVQQLLDPSGQPMFGSVVPNALDPAFRHRSPNHRYTIAMQQGVHSAGLRHPVTGESLLTRVWGYAANGRAATWPGRTFVAQRDVPVDVFWQNKLPRGHLLPVDTSVHWAYSAHGYEQRTIAADGVPAVAHLHGGHSDSAYDGLPEAWFSPGHTVRGPQWVAKRYTYDNDQPAATLWYHDHALGITRLNVYAGLAGFYILRDEADTGLVGNPVDLPAHPYEVGLAIQDRMFTEDGELFYPAFPGDPFYDDFITGEGAVLPPGLFPGGGPTALAEFFGDHMLVNGVVWPRMDVEPRHYRLRLLNGCDSRFLAVQLFEVPAGDTDVARAVQQLDMSVVGGDQGLASEPTTVDTLLVETGARYDVVVDFGQVTPGNRVVMRNIGGDEPFGGDIPGPQVFTATDRVMAFDVVLPLDAAVPDVHPAVLGFGPSVPTHDRLRRVALFEGMDEFGRLQPLLGTAEAATDHTGAPILWPATPAYADVGLVGPIEGTAGWHSPTTENPALGSTEEWELWNVSADAHPVHLHLVGFEVLGRQEIAWDSHTDEDDRVIPNDDHDGPAGDGTYLVRQALVEHDGSIGQGFRIVDPTYGSAVDQPAEYVENTAKDVVAALPGQVTRIRATFDKPGRYVWHCHILSHEDHEMMRVLHVGPGA
jgi:spore coat protein A, manganese oxidase